MGIDSDISDEDKGVAEAYKQDGKIGGCGSSCIVRYFWWICQL